MSDIPTRSFGVGDFANPNRDTGMLDSDTQTRRVDVRLIDANPFQKRALGRGDRLADGPAVAHLMKDLDANGQLAPVCVRRHPEDGTRFQLIYGHRRTEAFRRLLADAVPSETSRWSHITAIVRTDIADDAQLSALCIAENFQREDLTPFEEAESIAAHMEVANLSSATELAKALNIDAKRTTRLLRLHSAPQYIRKALERGLSVEVGEGSAPTKPKERIDLLASIEWVRLHDHMTQKQGKKLEAVSSALTPRLEESIRDRWPYRRVKEYVDARIAGRRERGEATPAVAPAPVFREEKGVLTVQVKRLDGISDEERGALRAALEAVLEALQDPSERAKST